MNSTARAPSDLRILPGLLNLKTNTIMKTSVRSILLVTALLLAPIAGFAQTPAPKVSLSLAVKKVDTKDKKGKDDKDDKKKAKAESETAKLVITLRNVSREPVAGVDVKYYFISRVSGDGPSTTSVAKEGSKTVEVPANGTAEVESEGFATTYTEAFTPKKGKREKAHGEKVIGWGVKAMAGDQVAAEQYSSDSAKQMINNPAAAEKK